MRNAAVKIQSSARKRRAKRVVEELLAEARLRATYEGQLIEARARLAAEANAKSELEAEKRRLEEALASGSSTKADEIARELERERREHSQELAQLLQQQEEELSALRGELQASNTALKRESESREKAERKAEQATLQLSVERAAHAKLQRALELEKQAAAAAKSRLKEAGMVAPVGAPYKEALTGESETDATLDERVLRAKRSGDERVEALQSELQQRDARELQLKSKIQHAQSEREQMKHKLERTLDQVRLRQAEWEREKQGKQRQIENLNSEIQKRDQWLKKAKDIITEYQKRSSASGIPQTARPTPRAA